MKTVFLIIMSSTIIFCNENTINFSAKNNFLYNQNMNQENFDQNISLKYPLYSLALPGLGEYALYKDTSDKRYKKIAISLFALEAIGWIYRIGFKNKYKNQKQKYKNYADVNWDFSDWIEHYNDFNNTPYEVVWLDSEGSYTHIGESSHYVQFYMGENTVRTTDEDFLNDYYHQFLEAIENGDNIYEAYEINIIKDQHFYENIGKYNEFFTGWEDADTSSIIIETTDQNYQIALSPIKNNYISSYDKAEKYSDVAEFSLTCIYFNHFISMLDAFVLPHILRKLDVKKSDKVMIHSSTIYDQKKSLFPIGIRVDFVIKL